MFSNSGTSDGVRKAWLTRKTPMSPVEQKFGRAKQAPGWMQKMLDRDQGYRDMAVKEGITLHDPNGQVVDGSSKEHAIYGTKDGKLDWHDFGPAIKVSNGGPGSGRHPEGGGENQSLPKKFWAIRREGKVVTSGNHVGMTLSQISDMAKTHNGEVVFGDESLGKKPEVGSLFGHTWQQISDMQQKKK